MPDWPFGDLMPLKYGFVLADPPWTFKLRSAKGEKKSAQAQYACMGLEDIKALPVSQLASGDCALMLWATWPMLPDALDVMRAWGFRFVSGGHWHKVTLSGKQAFGTGYRLRCASEPWLLGVIGNPATSRRARNAIIGVVREHSRKPEEAYQWAEEYVSNVWRCELFARQRRANWECWGTELDKFEAEVAG